MKQILIFVLGAVSMFIAICGAICGIQAIATYEGFLVVCGVIFLIAWVYLVIDWFKNKCYEDLASRVLNKD